VKIPVTTQAAGSFKVTTEVTTSDQTGTGTATASATLTVRALPTTTTTTTTTTTAVVLGLPSAPPSGPQPPRRRLPTTGMPALALVALAGLLIDTGALLGTRAARRRT
jgi:hypothetical protein